jgi:putative transcriptional regulator
VAKIYKIEALAALHETASDLDEIGLLSKQTMKRFEGSCLTPVPKLTPQKIKGIRKEAGTSQSMFARCPNAPSGLISGGSGAKKVLPSRR